MTAEQQLQSSEDTVEQPQAGTLLKQKREALGLTQKQIADRLRLRLSIIESIENNDFALDQVATFTRGYLRSYAKAVNLDEATVLSALAGCEETKPQEQQMKSFSRKTKREKHDSRIMTLTWGIFAVILGISSVWWWQNQDSAMVDLTTVSEQEQQLEQAAQPELNFTTLAESEADVVEEQPSAPVEEALAEPVVQDEEPSATETTIIDETAAEQPAEVIEPPVVEETIEPQATEQVAVAANLLQMTFSDDCWIQVKDADGKTLSTGVKKPGQELNLQGELPYSVILGAPENVSMTLASEPVDLSGYTSGKVARFNLP
ncbi:cytoskeleton protein RodZ [Vibrio sinaloensis]|uniref:cytoskeleton protein RodZ n=1 Tax=Photobacterium sp. (strain ATCC 43367) TaxID=379097 RepID=UPI002047DEEC|nr:cytoskeleton protein RodZ [Vibrio sinaloensis]UPQ87403.1 cytoskeleton protein RodZ [Vibrio sinaloensis]